MSDPLPEAHLDADYDRLIRGRRVALVHDWLTGMRGGEKVLEAIAEWFPGAPIYTLFCFPETISAVLRQHPIRTSFLQSRWLPQAMLKRGYRHLLPLFPQAIEDFDLSEFDLILSTSHCVAKGVIPGPEAVHLSYCHSPMRYAWDQEHAYFPKRGGPLGRLRGAALTTLRAWDAASVPRVDGFWANSNFVARRIQRYYRRTAEVLPPPVDVEAFAGTPETTTTEAPPFLLAVSALVPYKRLDLAIQASERLGIELRIVGTGPEASRLRQLAGPRTRFLGRVDDTTLQQLYREARAFVQPGVEDFGIAAVESLAAGTPVVALDRGGVRDIVADGVHGVLYGREDRAIDNESKVVELMTAIDKSSQIRFNPLDSTRRARDFSRDRFSSRLKASIARHLASGAANGHPGTDTR